MKSLATLFGAASILTAAGAAQAAPPMWVIKDADSTIYLMGTVHTLPPDLQWRSPAIDAALGEATQLWLETGGEDEAGMEALVPLIREMGISREKPLSALLTAEEMAALRTAAEPLVAMGYTMQTLDRMNPWLVSTLLQTVPSQGNEPTAGVERVLMPIAAAQGDALHGLETSVDQTRIVASLPIEAQVEMLREQLKPDTSRENGIVAAWAAGDITGIEQMNAEMKAEDPVAHEALLVRRNRNWTAPIQTLLQSSGVSFIAVGAGHLAGPDSLLVQLEARGITAQRVQ